MDYQTTGGIQYSGESKQESTYGGDNVAMAQDVLNAEPVARTDYSEGEAPF